MARIRFMDGQQRFSLSEGWEMTLEGSADVPPAAAEWIAAPVPGTAAQALVLAGKNTSDLLAGLQRHHIWYRGVFEAVAGTRLRFDGLAPHADVYLDETRVAHAASMFDPLEIELKNSGKTTIYLHFMPLTAETIPASARRQRWRPHLVQGPHLRNARTTLLGHMPGWCPPLPPVGPYRAVEIIADGPVTARHARVRSSLYDGAGCIEISIEINGMEGPFVASCWSANAGMQRGEGGEWRATLTLENPPLWWPHTHGDPHLLPLSIYGEHIEISLGSVGFRTLEFDRGADGQGFALICNGVPVFCRGANWTPPDISTLSGTYETYEPVLRQMRDAGMNMLRISGIMTREAPELFDIADTLGLLVWHDEPFANFDYDFEFLQEKYDIAGSLRRYLLEIETAPSLAVVCGGSEMAQQAAMLSLPESVWNPENTSKILESPTTQTRPDLTFVPNSPLGGTLPFQVDAGIAHYFGVGAYKRPLEDARRAGVRFASECLAFAHLPQPERLAANSGGAMPGTPEWDARVVRDLKADWNFEDTRDFYLALLYGVDPARLKVEDPARYLALSAAVPGEVMENTFAEWRRLGSETAGGLVWFNRDVQPGFGWGVVDHAGVPKPAWHALRRAFRPVTVVMTDEGLNGLYCHVINERGRTEGDTFTLTLTAYAADGTVVINGTKTFPLPRFGRVRFTSAELFGIFFDVTCAYHFGPPAHVVTVARLSDAAGASLAEAFHFPQGRAAAMADPGLSLAMETDAHGQPVLALRAERLAQSVHIAAEAFLPDDDWFHLAPGAGRRISLKGRGVPRGIVTALNGAVPVAFG